MSLETYSGLKASVANWLNRTDLATEIPDFIALVESRLAHELRIPSIEKTAYIITDIHGRATIPADFLEIKAKHDDIGNAQLENDYRQEAQAIFDFYLSICGASHNIIILHLARSMSSLLIENIERNLTILAKRPDIFSQMADYRKRLLNAIVSGQPQKAWGASHRHLAFIEEVLLKTSQENSRMQRSMRRMQRSEY